MAAYPALTGRPSISRERRRGTLLLPDTPGRRGTFRIEDTLGRHEPLRIEGRPEPLRIGWRQVEIERRLHCDRREYLLTEGRTHLAPPQNPRRRSNSVPRDYPGSRTFDQAYISHWSSRNDRFYNRNRFCDIERTRSPVAANDDGDRTSKAVILHPHGPGSVHSSSNSKRFSKRKRSKRSTLSSD